MITPGDSIVWRRAGVRIDFLETAASTHRARLHFLVTVPAERREFEIAHVHPSQEEAVTVRTGRLLLEVAGNQHHLGPGETMRVERGRPHRCVNAGEGPLLLEVEFRPAGQTEMMFEQMFGAANVAEERGKTFAGPLQISLWANAYEMYSALPSLWIQRALCAVLSPVARLVGCRLADPAFSAAARAVEPAPATTRTGT